MMRSVLLEIAPRYHFRVRPESFGLFTACFSPFHPGARFSPAALPAMHTALLAALAYQFAPNVPCCSFRAGVYTSPTVAPRLASPAVAKLLPRLPIVISLPDRRAFERELIAAKEDGVAMVIKLSRPRCRACIDVGHKLDWLARKKPHHRFFEVDVKTPGGRSIVEAMGRPEGLPTVAIYDAGSLVFSKPLPLRLFGEVVEVLDQFDEAHVDAIRESKVNPGLGLAASVYSTLRRVTK
ncbi:hypothetical protein AB1Y20_009097 [Prymnesium parvum]|uniref:Thioredoxin domain-containing protein n=1 Tax=Prymnesium parvum TaxID=97485 RepID=A0AB34K3E3_PRYPA